jgi:hypothetical protein
MLNARSLRDWKEPAKAGVGSDTSPPVDEPGAWMPPRTLETWRETGRAIMFLMRSPLNPWHVSPDDFPGDSYASDQPVLARVRRAGAVQPQLQPWLFRINTADVEIHADRRAIGRWTRTTAN